MLEDVLIRPAVPADIDDLIHINIAVWHSTYRGLVHDDLLDAMTPDSLRAKWERTVTGSPSPDRLCSVSVLHENVIGYIVCGKNRDEHFPFEWELFAIYLLAEYQGKGIGRKLFFEAVNDMKKREVRSFVVFVLEENFATRKFYEHFDPDYQTRKIIELGGKQYAELGYGWSDIQHLK